MKENSYINDRNIDDSGFDLNFKVFLNVLIRRKKYFYLGFLITIFSAGVVTILQRAFLPIYTGSFTVLITDPISKKDNGMSEMGSPIFDQLYSGSSDNDVPTLIEFLRSSMILQDTAKKYNLEMEDFKDALKIEVIDTDRKVFSKPAGALNVYLTYKNPKIGLNVLEDLKKVYLKTALDQRQKRLATGLDFLNAQAPNLENNTLKIQRKLSDFQEKYNLLDPKKEAIMIKEKIALLQNDIFQLNVKKGKFKTIREKIAKGKLSSSGFEILVSDSTNPQQLEDKQGLLINNSNSNILRELIKLKAEYAEKITKYLPSSEIVVGIKKRIDQLEPVVLKSQLESVDSAIELNAALIKTAQSQKKELDQVFYKLPKLIAEFESLTQDLILALEKRKALVEARENFQLEIAQKNAPWQIIEEPYFEINPTFPSYKNNLILGILLSSITGFLAALIKDKVDNVFHSSIEVKDELNENVLTHIPNLTLFSEQDFSDKSVIELLDEFKIKKLEDTESSKNLVYENFLYQEALRSLYTSIKFSSIDNQIKLITLTSCIPAEGKSLINILIAKTISDIGKKVLLIDADMRKPQIHKRLALNNIYGLSNLLSETTLKYKDICQSINPNFDVMTSGTVPPDPTKLLISKRMTSFLKEIKNDDKYDYVIIDSPPIIGISDGFLIADNSDCIVLLVSLFNVKKDLPFQALEKIKEKKLNLLGLITNSKVKSENELIANSYAYAGYGNNKNPLSAYINNDQIIEGDKSEVDLNENKLISKIKDFSKKYLNKLTSWLDK